MSKAVMTVDEVREGQVWADNDWRSRGRTLRVLRVENEHALCVILTDGPHPIRSAIGRTTAIKLRRFKPNSTGYRLVTGAVNRPGSDGAS